MTFAEALSKAMTERRVNLKQLSARTGINTQTISNLRRGVNKPQVNTASLLADALHWDELAQMVTRDRTRTCPVCERTFITQHKTPERRKFCSHRCQQVAWNRQANSSRERRRAKYEKKTTMLLREHQQAVEAMCRSCEPVDFICRDSVCPLRGISPLPLIQLTRKAA